MQPKIGIILINYKTYAKRFLEDCRDSMRKIEYPREKYVVYIVDNATSPETQAYLREMYPEAVVLPNKENSGWGGGNNIGIEQAFADGCEDIVLSNMDVIVHKDWLKELVTVAYGDIVHNSPQPSLTFPPKADPPRAEREGDRSGPPLTPPSKGGEKIGENPLRMGEEKIGENYFRMEEGTIEISPPLVGGVRGGGRPIGMVQSKLLLHPIKDGVQRVNSLGNEIHFLGFGYCKGYGEVDGGANCESIANLRISNSQIRKFGSHSEFAPYDITYASGASCYVKGEVLKKIGLCNPDFFMYHDDIEFCLKAKFVGYRIVLAPKSIMWHKYEFGRSVMQIYYMERNRLITMLEFYKLPTLILLAPAFFIMELGVLFGALLGGYAKPKLRSWGYFFKPDSWRAILRDRRKIQSMRTMRDSELMADFTGKILFKEVMNPILRYAVNPVFNLYWQIIRHGMFW